MNNDEIRLRRNEVTANKRGVRSISCHSGILWITASGTGDILLRAGETLESRGMSDLCVQALEDSVLRVEACRASLLSKGDAPATKSHGSRRNADASTTRLPLAANL